MVKRKSGKWYTGDDEESEKPLSFKQYKINTAPNDFNVKTIYEFITDGMMELPNFQRNYVWDLKKASRFIESIIMGLPIPQIFLYEKSKDNFLVIDGQQRLMTIYYFIKNRFPKQKYRAELRKIFDRGGIIPENILKDDEIFEEFKLNLPSPSGEEASPLDKLNYFDIGDTYRHTFDFRPIRNIVITQTEPPKDDSSIYEIFNRLNTGGVNLNPQEIRASLYDSDFYRMLYRINSFAAWRKILRKPEDSRMKDVEVLLRGFAMLYNSEKYKSPMGRFLNGFSAQARKMNKTDIEYLELLFKKFIEASLKLKSDAFYSKSNKFNISVYEAIFNAACKKALKAKNLDIKNLTNAKLKALKFNAGFIKATFSETAKTENVKKRLSIAEKIIGE
jgi:uncharacterized protein with ParB-like and HNH nuclease domain